LSDFLVNINYGIDLSSSVADGIPFVNTAVADVEDHPETVTV
jgi:hypothetical protein